MAIDDVLSYKNAAGTELMKLDKDGNLTVAGTLGSTGTDDFGSGGIKADAIAESTAGAGVTIDGALIKDAHIVDSVGFYDAAAPTKIARIDAGSITAGQTRVITMPDANVALVADPASLANLASIANAKGASLIGIEDTATWYAAANLETAFAELAVAIGGSNSTTRNYSSNLVVADNDTLVVAAGKLDARLGAYADQVVVATLTCSSPTGGATDAAFTAALTRADGGAVASARQVLVTAVADGADAAGPATTLAATVTFNTATVGSIITSGNGWALIETSAAGAFACTATNSADGDFTFAASTAIRGVSDAAKVASVIGCAMITPSWAA
jgi:hypothetical protein